MLDDRQDDDRPLKFLTIPQAGKALGIGRTKAYAMAQRWRDTDGREGLPNVDLCGSYRVPVWALKKMVDDALAPTPVHSASAPDASEHPPVEPTPLTKSTRTRGRRSASPDQPRLFDLPPAS